MKKISSAIYLVIFLLFANQAFAAKWVLLAPSDNGDMYYDKSIIKTVNEKIMRVWTKIIFNEKGETEAFSNLKSIGEVTDNSDILSHISVLCEIDCVNGKYRTSSLYYYDEKHNLVHSSQNPSKELSDIPPDTPFETLKNIVCSTGNTSKTKKK